MLRLSVGGGVLEHTKGVTVGSGVGLGVIKGDFMSWV